MTPVTPALRYLHRDAWLPVTLPVSSSSEGRSAALTGRILDAVNLQHPRYTRDSRGQTKCNILVWDVSRAHGCEVAHLTLRPGRRLDQALIRNLQAAGLPQDALDQLLGPRWGELDANAQVVWLSSGMAGDAGWRICGPAEALEAGNAGVPCVAAWFNAGAVGHVAWVIDTPTGESELNICQAGATNARRCRLSAGFGAATVTFFVHD